jgi:hypothetical protein
MHVDMQSLGFGVRLVFHGCVGIRKALKAVSQMLDVILVYVEMHFFAW